MKKIICLFLIVLIIPFIKAQEQTKSTSNSMSMSAAPISVTIGGDFVITGTFPAYISERVDAFVTRMYNEARDKVLRTITDRYYIQQINKKLEEYSIRNITLKRANGEIVHIDLEKFRLTGDFSNDPYLKNDDVLIFAPSDMERDFFTVSGAVNNPGKFPFVDGDKLPDALMLAQGINKAYEDVTKAAIYRLNYNGEQMNKIIVDVNSDAPLQRGDRIDILADETQRKEFQVLVLGEVKRPGFIPISKGNTTIREALEYAGGITDQASLERAKLIRGTSVRFILEKQFGLNLLQQETYLTDYPNPLLFEYEKDKMKRMSTLTEKDTLFFAIDEQIRQMLNQSSVSFDSALNPNSSVGNLKLRDGDIIVVPQKLNTVYVYGQVVNQGNVRYIEGKDYSYYIEQAGGLGGLANKGEISVIKGDSREWVQVGSKPLKIEPGDFIYIPKRPNYSFDYYVSRLGVYLGIVGSTATIILLLLQFKK